MGGSEDGSIFIWNLQTREVVQKLEGHTGKLITTPTHFSTLGSFPFPFPPFENPEILKKAFLGGIAQLTPIRLLFYAIAVHLRYQMLYCALLATRHRTLLPPAP